MKKLSLSTFLVLLILPHVARARSTESVPLLGTIQFPLTLKSVIEPIHIIYEGTPTRPKVDQTSKHVTFQLPRDSNQFNFKLLIAEPQHIQPVLLSSKHQAEPTNNIAYQRIVNESPYRYFMLQLVPTINKDSNKSISYSWLVRESFLPDASAKEPGKIPDDAIIMYMDPYWIEKVAADTGFYSLTVQIKKNIIELVGSEKKFKDKLNAITIATLDKKHLEGEKPVEHQKQVGNTIIIAPPLKQTTA